MNKKFKPSALSCMVLLVTVSFFGFFGSRNIVCATQPVPTMAIAEYDYYVVAGHNIIPTLPPPAPYLDGFHLTFYSSANGTGVYNPAPVYNFGNITKWGGRSYLYHGVESAPGPMGAAVDIQNLLGYDITILDLTVKVKTCTPIPDYTRNSSMVMVDTLDPWDNGSGMYDECNYNNGFVVVKRMPDMTGGVPLDVFALKYRDPTGYPEGPGSLVEPDKDGDAAATGHVAPIALPNGATFTEYFGVIISGRPDEGTQINGTITLALTYEFEFITPPEVPAPSFTYTPSNPLITEIVTFDASNSTHNGENITSYEWNFGDRSTGSGIIVNHTYTTLGTYTVVLNVTNTRGLWITESDVVIVGELSGSADELPWVMNGVAIVVLVVVVAVAFFLVRRRK